MWKVTLMMEQADIQSKLIVLVVMALFAGICYLILPKMMSRKIKGYHEQCEMEEDEEEQLNGGTPLSSQSEEQQNEK